MHRAAPSRLDPIAAQATPRGPAERGILRLSGPGLVSRAAALLPPECPRPTLPPRRELLRGRAAWAPGACVELALWVQPGPATVTGEDVLELHLPGAQPVLDALLADLLARGARLAEPGEFTRRAVLNGRMDLVQAEAVLDLVQASGAAAARAAAGVLAGGLRPTADAARAALTAALVELEAGLDFEEGDSQDLAPAEVDAALAQAEAAVGAGLRAETLRGAGARSEFRILLHGAPNAGKTSLFRALTGADALVSAEAGTTRDRLEAAWRHPAAAGTAWILMDGPGAGRAGPTDARDAAARARAQADVGEADLVWLCADVSAEDDDLPAIPTGVPALLVLTKADLPSSSARRAAALATGLPLVAVSAACGSGLDELAARSAEVEERAEASQRARAAAAARHAEALGAARSALARARTLLAAGGAQDLVAEEVRAALQALGELSGAFAPEDLLDRLFARFCVGK